MFSDDRFGWHTFDVRPLLPPTWQEEIQGAVAKHASRRTLKPTSVTSREGAHVIGVPVETVGGVSLRRAVPWLFEFYAGPFLELAQTLTPESVCIASDDRIAVNLNVQRGRSMRYEAHVDSNPIEGLLYCTTFPEGMGGELAVANNASARSIEEIEQDATVVYPVAGHLVFFDARKFPHYVRPLRDDNAIRIVVAMNYYTPSCPEAMRPKDLNRHLFGDSKSLRKDTR